MVDPRASAMSYARQAVEAIRKAEVVFLANDRDALRNALREAAVAANLAADMLPTVKGPGR